ncbi:hypothetical protein NT239_04270 [Chitinibacter sp. SCUT-21]|uniref:hypothetical protein n=1 Tax=Chitinibacter sp. SCUT-21 TaxID=2970891 RepID=UPI0035A6FE6A
MKGNLRKIILISAASLLAACSTPQHQGSEAKPVAKAQPNSPSILIVGRSTKAVSEDIIRFRTSKGMKLLSRSPTYLEFSANIAKANLPTEARIQYTLTQSQQGWQLSAKVLQISYPASKKEKIEDITLHVSDKLNEELARYATN